MTRNTVAAVAALVVGVLVGATVPTTVAPAAAQEATVERFDGCSVMIGMSQVRNTFHGAYDSLTPEDQASFKQHWFLHWYPGQVLGGWANPDNAGWTDPRFDLGDGIRVGVDDTCANPTHASFGFDPATGPTLTMHEALDQVVDNIRAEYPTVETVDVWLLVGDENHGSCLLGSNLVRAADLHRNSFDEWQSYVGPVGVGLGPDLHVPCPSGWRDSKGHLSDSGAMIAGSDWLAFQATLKPDPDSTSSSSTEPPATTTTMAASTTTACAVP